MNTWIHDTKVMRRKEFPLYSFTCQKIGPIEYYIDSKTTMCSYICCCWNSFLVGKADGSSGLWQNISHIFLPMFSTLWIIRSYSTHWFAIIKTMYICSYVLDRQTWILNLQYFNVFGARKSILHKLSLMPIRQWWKLGFVGWILVTFAK